MPGETTNNKSVYHLSPAQSLMEGRSNVCSWHHFRSTCELQHHDFAQGCSRLQTVCGVGANVKILRSGQHHFVWPLQNLPRLTFRDRRNALETSAKKRKKCMSSSVYCRWTLLLPSLGRLHAAKSVNKEPQFQADLVFPKAISHTKSPRINYDGLHNRLSRQLHKQRSEISETANWSF